MFKIELVEKLNEDPKEAQRFQITIGDFTEDFFYYSFDHSIGDIVDHWRFQLHKLIEDSDFACLQHDPRFAWVLYREDKDIYVRQVLALDGDFSIHSERGELYSDNGKKISEWHTTIEEIQEFLIR